MEQRTVLTPTLMDDPDIREKVKELELVSLDRKIAEERGYLVDQEVLMRTTYNLKETLIGCMLVVPSMMYVIVGLPHYAHGVVKMQCTMWKLNHTSRCGGVSGAVKNYLGRSSSLRFHHLNEYPIAGPLLSRCGADGKDGLVYEHDMEDHPGQDGYRCYNCDHWLPY